MRIIKPGKLGNVSSLPKIKKVESNSNRREAWDDFSPSKTTSKVVTKKKEYSKGVGDRMIPQSSLSRYDQAEVQDDLNALPQIELEKYESRSDLEFLEQALGFEFSDRAYLSRALTHRSALGFKERADYERLEFLGDAVLDLSVAHLLSDLHPDAREGELSKMRAALVNTQALAQIAKGLGMSPFVKLGRGEFSAGGAERPSILADVMEAVIGAVYRDSSYEVALSLVERIFGSALKEVTPFDPKTELQEVLHLAGSEPPSYLLELVEGPEHAPTFVTVVNVDGQVVGRGRGNTKKAAQQEAAAQAILRMMYDAKDVNLKDGQRFFIESGLLLPTEVDRKRRPAIEQLPDKQAA
jgi:ribonuclease-3